MATKKEIKAAVTNTELRREIAVRFCDDFGAGTGAGLHGRIDEVLRKHPFKILELLEVKDWTIAKEVFGDSERWTDGTVLLATKGLKGTPRWPEDTIAIANTWKPFRWLTYKKRRKLRIY